MIGDIIFINKTDISRHSVEYVHSNGPNSWGGWWCSAGIRTLYISHDGLIYRGACRVGGVIGSIYNQGSDRASELSSWVKCTAINCTCAPGMRAPKVTNFKDTAIVGVNHQHLPEEYLPGEDLKATVDIAKKPHIVYSQVNEEFKVVVWELGRRCNYDCWYCAPSAHNTYEAQKTLGSMMAGYEHLASMWLIGEKAKFVFSGGETTFNPDFMEFAEFLAAQGHLLHVTTNGSHTTDYYTSLAKISSVSFSAHLEYLTTPNIYKKFIKNVEASTINRGINYVEVRIMLEPGKLEEAQQLYQDLKAVTPIVQIDLLHGTTRNIMDYSTEEQAWATSLQ